MKRFVVVVSCLFASSAALAQSPSESATTQTAPSAQSNASPAGGTTSRDDETVCRRIAADTGSRISGRQRVCMTRRQWREHDRRN